MVKKLLLFLMVTATLLSACASSPTAAPTLPPDAPVTAPPPGEQGTPAPAPWDPAPGDEKLIRAAVDIQRSDILILESFPPQFRLELAGELPSQCHKLRAIVSGPDDQNRISVEVYTLVEPDVVCTLATQPFSVSIPLGSYAEGAYTVWVNSQQVGEIAP